MGTLAANHLCLPLQGCGGAGQHKRIRPALCPRGSTVYATVYNVSIKNTRSLRCVSRGASMSSDAMGGNGGNGGPRALPPTGEEDGWAGRFRPVFPSLLVALLGCTSVAPTHAIFKKKKKQPETLDQFSGRLVKLYWPIMANLGFSGGIGLACGLALRAVGQALAIALGILFVVIQGAAYMGFLEVKWATVHKEVIRRLDVNKDGAFDASDFKSLLASGLAVLSQGVPSVGGFLAGFALGIK